MPAATAPRPIKCLRGRAGPGEPQRHRGLSEISTELNELFGSRYEPPSALRSPHDRPRHPRRPARAPAPARRLLLALRPMGRTRSDRDGCGRPRRSPPSDHGAVPGVRRGRAAAGAPAGADAQTGPLSALAGRPEGHQRSISQTKKSRHVAGSVDVPGIARTAPDGVPEGPKKRVWW